jgi:hypothetical protein
VLDQLGHDPKAGVQTHPVLELEESEETDNNDDDESIQGEAAPTPKKMKTPMPKKTSYSSKSSSKADVPSPSVVRGTPSGFVELEEAAVNEVLPWVYELDDNKHLFGTRWPAVASHNKTNCYFEFSEVAEAIAVMVVCPKSQHRTKGLLKGYEGCDEGSPSEI